MVRFALALGSPAVGLAGAGAAPGALPPGAVANVKPAMLRSEMSSASLSALRMDALRPPRFLLVLRRMASQLTPAQSENRDDREVCAVLCLCGMVGTFIDRARYLATRATGVTLLHKHTLYAHDTINNTVNKEVAAFTAGQFSHSLALGSTRRGGRRREVGEDGRGRRRVRELWAGRVGRRVLREAARGAAG